MEFKKQKISKIQSCDHKDKDTVRFICKRKSFDGFACLKIFGSNVSESFPCFLFSCSTSPCKSSVEKKVGKNKAKALFHPYNR